MDREVMGREEKGREDGRAKTREGRPKRTDRPETGKTEVTAGSRSVISVG